MDEWQLPVTETSGTCELSVRINSFSVSESSSWMVIKAAARELNGDCRVKAALGDVTGGAITIGRHDRIRISLARKRSGEAADG